MDKVHMQESHTGNTQLMLEIAENDVELYPFLYE